MTPLACGHDERCWIDACPPGCGEADRTHCLACRARAEALDSAAAVVLELSEDAILVAAIHAIKDKQP